MRNSWCGAVINEELMNRRQTNASESREAGHYFGSGFDTSSIKLASSITRKSGIHKTEEISRDTNKTQIKELRLKTVIWGSDTY